MPITVLCHCGRKFSANDRLAGRSINCPSCGRTISVPPPASDAADEDDELTLAPDPEFDEPQVPEHSVPREDELKSKADEIRRSLDSAAKNVKSRITAAHQPLQLDKDDLDTRPRCPGCGGVLLADVVICLECGYNRRTGRKIEPSRESEIMARAEAAVAEEAEGVEDEGLSAWFYGSALGAMLLMFVIFFLFPSHILALVIAPLILLAGTVLFGYGFVLAIIAGDYLFLLRILLVILLGGFRLLFILFRLGQGGETTTLHDINDRDHEKWCIYGVLLFMFGLFVLTIGLCSGGGADLSLAVALEQTTTVPRT